LVQYFWTEREVRMRKTLLACIALTVFGVSTATAGVITDRQNIMKSFAQANTALNGMMYPNPYDTSLDQAQLRVLSGGAAKLGDMFPTGSDKSSDPAEKTLALPTVWSDTPGFQAALAKFTSDVKAAQVAYDSRSFTNAYPAVAADCGACHRTYRAPLPRPAGAPAAGGAGGPPPGTQ
jgi:cytochrome c556